MSVNDKVTQGSKWGELFLGEDLVPLYIPPDPLNPAPSVWLAINGQEIVLAVGENLTVPRSVAELWQQSHQQTLAAEAMMNRVVEIGN